MNGSSSMGETLWQLEDVFLRGTARPRLDAATLEIDAGTTAVVGPSGAGKTSLLNLLVEFEEADAGEVRRVFPHSVDALPLYWAPQEGGLWPHLSAMEHLRTVAPPGETEAKLLELLSAFDIGEKARSRPEELSLGERARLSVARALAARAAVLVMDEPFANVDLARQCRYWDAVRRHIDRTGASLVYATHSPKTVLREAERVICLDAGRVLYAGEVDELYRRPASPELMDCLGEGNWLLPDEARLWLTDVRFRRKDRTVPGGEATHEGQVPPGGSYRTWDAARCLRPEQIRLERAEDSPLVVRRSRFQGSVAEVELEHEKAGALRRFFHRPSSDALRPGDRVLVKLVLTCILCIVPAACERSVGAGATERLPVREVRHWSVPSDGARIPAPRAVAVGRDDEVYVLDTGGRVLVYDDTGMVMRRWRMPEAEVGKPEGVLVLADGTIAVADTHYHRVVFFDAEGRLLGMLGRYGRGEGEFIYPVALASDDDGNLYVAEYGGNDRVQKFARQGRGSYKFLLAFGGFGTGPGRFQRLSGIVWRPARRSCYESRGSIPLRSRPAPQGASPHESGASSSAAFVTTRPGRIIVADAINNRLQVFSDAGEFVGMLGEGLSLHFPYGIAVSETPGGAAALYVIEYGAGRISKVGLGGPDRGRPLGRFGKSGHGRGEFHTPWAIAVDSAGRLRVADTGNRRVVALELLGRP